MALKNEAIFTLVGVIDALANAYRQKDGWRYRAFLGDIRKVKRFVNTLLMLRLGDLNLELVDLNKKDLLHLLLLYLTYPGRFRDVYAHESEGRTGIYAVSRKVVQGTHEYTNHTELAAKFTASLDGETFLLSQLFDPASLHLNDQFRNDDEEVFFKTRACFNDSSRRNLERYLKLLVELDAPEPEESLSYFLSYFERLRSGELTIAEVAEKLRTDKGEEQTSELWRIIANRANQLEQQTADQIIRYLTNALPTYGVLDWSDPAIGIRNDSTKALVRILDEVGWGGDGGNRRDNTGDNTARIAWWIFDSSIADGHGILMTLLDDRRGLLGFNDALMFRLYCNPGRSSLFNLSGALIRHADPSARTDGIVAEMNKNAVREISQMVFRTFRERYIYPAKNVFAQAAALSIRDLAGQFDVPIQALLAEGVDSKVADQIERSKRAVVNFSIYQLANRSHGDSACGCGFFDEKGDGDGGGIAQAMNEYVFGVCFDPKISIENLEFFADFMLSDMEQVGAGMGRRPTLAGLLGGLDKEMLGAYWLANKSSILPLTEVDCIPRTVNGLILKRKNARCFGCFQSR